jgi:hypothetical protein
MAKEGETGSDRIGVLGLELESKAERQWESLFSLVYVKNRIAGKSLSSFEEVFRIDEDGPIDYTAQVIPMGTVSHRPHFITVVVLRNDDIVMAGMASASWHNSLPSVADIRLFGMDTKEIKLDPLVIASMGQLSVSPRTESMTHATVNVDFPARPQLKIH